MTNGRLVGRGLRGGVCCSRTGDGDLHPVNPGKLPHASLFGRPPRFGPFRPFRPFRGRLVPRGRPGVPLPIMNGNGCFPMKRGAFPLTNGLPVVK